MRSLRYRPFGVVGSTVEVLVGLYLLLDALTPDEDYPGWIVAIELLLALGILGAGLFGLVIAARRRFGSAAITERDTERRAN
jgi:hypothetical protein